MRKPPRITSDIRDFNSLDWFDRDEAPNTTCVLAGDNVEQMISVLVRSHLGNGDLPIIAGTLNGSYADFTRAFGGIVIPVTGEPEEQLPADVLNSRMICLDLSSYVDADIDTLRCGLTRTLDYLVALSTKLENHSGQLGSSLTVHERHLAVFLDGILASPPATEELYRRFDEVSRRFPLTMSCYFSVDVDRVPEGHFSNVEGVYTTGIIERTGRIICGTTRTDNAERLRQILGLNDRQIALVTNPRIPAETTVRVGKMPHQYLMVTLFTHPDEVTDWVGIDDEGALFQETTTVTDYGSTYETFRPARSWPVTPDGTFMPVCTHKLP